MFMQYFMFLGRYIISIFILQSFPGSFYYQKVQNGFVCAQYTLLNGEYLAYVRLHFVFIIKPSLDILTIQTFSTNFKVRTGSQF